jgi:hemerythrin
MTLLQWKDAYSAGIDPVDRDHRALIDLINRLHDELEEAAARSAPASVTPLLERISAHIALEERVMQDHGYADLASHKADHERLVENLCDLILMHAYERPDEADCRELAQRLDSWLCNHFGTHDGKFHRELASAGAPSIANGKEPPTA